MSQIESYKYQLLLLGNYAYINKVRKALKMELEKGLKQLRIPVRCLSFVKLTNQIDDRFPALGLFFGSSPHSGCMLMRELEKLNNKGVPVFPVVRDLSHFREETPKPLHLINGIPLNPDTAEAGEQISALVNWVMSTFHLVRNQRKVFISYCRRDTETVAIQLFEKLSAHGFNVFLDSYRIKKGDKFQKELEHQLKDSDIMLVLHSENYIQSPWVQKELEEANTLQIGIVEVRWAGRGADREYESRYGELSHTVLLKEVRQSRCLSQRSWEKITLAVEQWQIRSMQARIANLMDPFLKCLQKENRPYDIYPPHTVITVVNGVYVVFVLAVGVPDAAMMDDERIWVENRLFPNASHKVRICIVYDLLYLKERWKEHLQWLDSSLPVKSIHIREQNLCISNILDKWD